MVDGLAKFSLSLDKSSRIFNCMPPFVSLAVRANCMGILFPRGF